MSARIDIIAPGYAESIQNTNNMRARGSCCLARVSRKTILFDTLGPWDELFLAQQLARHKIHPSDIDHVVCSHSHPDHIGNLNMFTKNCDTNMRHFVGTSCYNQDVYFDQSSIFPELGKFPYKLSSSNGACSSVNQEAIHYGDYQLEANVKLRRTPGHTIECISLIVDNCDTYGRVALAGDLFERQDDIDDADVWLSAGSQDDILQQLYRTAIYKSVDYILPGHGDIFKTEVGKKLSSSKHAVERTVISSANWTL